MSLQPYHALWQFQRDFGQPYSLVPGLPPAARRTLRKNLLAEEYQEYLDAEQDGDLVGIADALIDMVYIAYGTGVEYGLPMDLLFDEVHRSNMSKLDPDTGRPIKRADGKILKPLSYSPPNLAQIIEDAQIIDRVLGTEEVRAKFDARITVEGVDERDAAVADCCSRLDNGIKGDAFTLGDAEHGLQEVEQRIDDVFVEIDELRGEFEVAGEAPLIERFMVYVGCGSMPKDRQQARVEQVKADFEAQTAASGDPAIYYFIATEGETRVERL